MSQPQVVMLVVSVDQASTAKSLIQALLHEQLAACVHCLPQGSSHYYWEGTLQESREQTLLIKTAVDRVAEAMARIVDLHPYEVPEILQFSATGGFADYVQWVQAQTRPGS